MKICCFVKQNLLLPPLSFFYENSGKLPATNSKKGLSLLKGERGKKNKEWMSKAILVLDKRANVVCEYMCIHLIYIAVRILNSYR